MDRNLFEKLHELLNAEDHAEARALINQTLIDIEGTEPSNKLMLQAELFGFLCDVGSESENEGDLQRSIAFMEANAVALEGVIQKSSFYYNLANAKSALAKLQMAKERGVRSPYETQAALQEAITIYWMAYNSVLGAKELQDEIAINLSNTLMHAGRFIEALQFLDIVLRRSPRFPQALTARAGALHALPFITSGGLTASLLTQEFNDYRTALGTGDVIPSVEERCKSHMEEALAKLGTYGFGLPDIDAELAETAAEYRSLSDLRRFSIDHFLTLNEHAIYCPCIAARWDNLQVGLSHLKLAGKVVPLMELLLNRLKSEYALARWMYFNATVARGGCELDSKFSELFEGEALGPETEMLRTSFRQCYGILDKLAMGICELYDIDAKKLYFESFWEAKSVKEKLMSVKNIHLNALHSIACDLNAQTGELRHFKLWRNALEHRLLILKDGATDALDPLALLDDEMMDVVDLSDFRDRALHLLQLTRAAIMSFTFCVRLHTMSKDDGNGRGAFVVDFRK